MQVMYLNNLMKWKYIANNQWLHHYWGEPRLTELKQLTEQRGPGMHAPKTALKKQENTADQLHQSGTQLALHLRHIVLCGFYNRARKWLFGRLSLIVVDRCPVRQPVTNRERWQLTRWESKEKAHSSWRDLSSFQDRRCQTLPPHPSQWSAARPTYWWPSWRPPCLYRSWWGWRGRSWSYSRSAHPQSHCNEGSMKGKESECIWLYLIACSLALHPSKPPDSALMNTPLHP